ncbi:IS6 family transposase [Enterococcus faecium]
MNHFKGKQFQQVQEILYDRGINVSHTTIYRWVQEYGKLLYQIWKKKNKKSFYSWKMDETYIKIKGKWHYLYRAIDADGLTLDIWLRKKRDTQAAYAFEILYDRGINVSHTTIYRWVQEYGKLLYQIWKKKNKKSFYSWKMDETYIKIKGKWHYLYRAIDADGLTLDIWLRKKRDTQAAYAFLKRLVKQFDEPKVVVTDKAPSITSAFKKLKEYGFYQGTEHRTIKYLNNLIEQDHRPVKRRNKFYRSLRTASTTIKGMEAIRGLYKKTRKEGTLFGFSVCTEIKVLLGIPA